MRRVVVTEFLTLDGVTEAPGGEFHPDGKGGWTFPFFTDEAGKFKFDELYAADALRLGETTTFSSGVAVLSYALVREHE